MPDELQQTIWLFSEIKLVDLFGAVLITEIEERDGWILFDGERGEWFFVQNTANITSVESLLSDGYSFVMSASSPIVLMRSLDPSLLDKYSATLRDAFIAANQPVREPFVRLWDVSPTYGILVAAILSSQGWEQGSVVDDPIEGGLHRTTTITFDEDGGWSQRLVG